MHSMSDEPGWLGASAKGWLSAKPCYTFKQHAVSCSGTIIKSWIVPFFGLSVEESNWLTNLYFCGVTCIRLFLSLSSMVKVALLASVSLSQTQVSQLSSVVELTTSVTTARSPEFLMAFLPWACTVSKRQVGHGSDDFDVMKVQGMVVVSFALVDALL